MTDPKRCHSDKSSERYLKRVMYTFYQTRNLKFDQWYNMFLSEKTMDIVNCKTTFEGVYQFKYEVNFGGGGICDSDKSLVVACQEPGSPYVDNQVMDMHFAKCPEVTSSANESKYISLYMAFFFLLHFSLLLYAVKFIYQEWALKPSSGC